MYDINHAERDVYENLNDMHNEYLYTELHCKNLVEVATRLK